MAGRLAGKRVIVTDCNEYAGADIVKLFREEDGEVFAVDRDLTVPGAADDLIREVGPRRYPDRQLCLSAQIRPRS
jgi:NAD(P)-dependent dehydrogenase (short-subunit alcohol dehydrogenase family)